MISNFFEIQYPLKIFKENNFKYSWYTIFIGRELKVIPLEEIIIYAKEFLFEHPDNRNKYIWELAFESVYNADYLLDHIYTTLGIEKNSKDWNREWIKWRYCILNYWKNKIENTEELMRTVEMIYTQFGYPTDMESFIYYMPDKTERNSKNYTVQENYEYLKNNLDKFLDHEKLKINKDLIDTLPKRILEYS